MVKAEAIVVNKEIVASVTVLIVDLLACLSRFQTSVNVGKEALRVWLPPAIIIDISQATAVRDSLHLSIRQLNACINLLYQAGFFE